MADSETLMETLAGFARNLTGRYGINEVLLDLAERVTEVLDLAGVGVALRQDERISFAAASREWIAELERVQERTQQGPCIEAIRSGRVVTLDDLGRLDGGESWPEYREAAARSQIRAVAGIPMLADGDPIGAVSLYNSLPRAWDGADLQAAQVLADIATCYLVHASRLHQQRRMAEQLRYALDSRIVIEQAKGIVAASDGIGVDEAFQRIRKYARDHNAQLRAVASAVVNLGLRF